MLAATPVVALRWIKTRIECGTPRASAICGAARLGGDQPGPRFRMLIKEVAQGHEELRGVLDSTIVQRLPDVINDHGSDRFPTVRLLAQIAGERCCGYLRDVFVLSDRQHFAFIEATKTDAVFQRDHVKCLQSCKACNVRKNGH